jgi:hypothetical protein
VQKNAMALGYFFLAVFCVFASAHSSRGLHVPLLLAALAATLVGIGFLLSALAQPFQAGLAWLKQWLVQLFHQAQQPPVRESKLRDGTGV